MASALTPQTVGPVVMRESEQLAAQRVALGTCLASYRDRSGLSQQELAGRLYYDRTSISKIETGQQPAPRAFWCAADRLLSADGELVAGFDALASVKAAAMASQRLCRCADRTTARRCTSGRHTRRHADLGDAARGANLGSDPGNVSEYGSARHRDRTGSAVAHVGRALPVGADG
jgi:DNA-binding XRE family transcriptional regulator